MSAHTQPMSEDVRSRPTAGALKLVVLVGPDEGLERAFEGRLELGSGPDVGMSLSDPAISRRHVAFEVSERTVRVEDLGSRNGVFVGGLRIGMANVPLGTVVTVGHSQVTVVPRWHISEVAPSSRRSFGDLYGESRAMRELFAILERAAQANVSVLVEGESGTGKELVARSLHGASPRASGPYVVVDCGAIAPELIESELFGHKKGAFTGALGDRAGAFQRASGGTLCLDELGELPLELQPKLLRALEGGTVKPLGSDQPVDVDVRVVASTNRDLEAEVRRKRFREDLFFRLNVIKLTIPPLRHRPEDIPGLVARLTQGELLEGDEVGGNNLEKLMSYSWPGNVRELRNVLSRALALSRPPHAPKVPFAQWVFNLGPAASTPSTLGADYPGVASHLPFKEARSQVVESFERAYMGALLSRAQGNMTRAAQLAGVSRSFLYELLKERGVAPDSATPEVEGPGEV